MLQNFHNSLGGSLVLGRYPLQKRELLRPWDAADEYILEYLDGDVVSEPLIINDNFGALSCALSSWQPTLLTDSFIAKWSAEENLINNKLALERVSIISPLDPIPEKPLLVIIRIPQSLAALEDTLIRLKPCLTEKSRIIACGMVKQIRKSTLALFEQIIGPTRTSLAKKKARLIFSQPDLNLPLQNNPYPSSYILEDGDYTLYNHSTVFCRDKLDIGTRFLLQNLPAHLEQRCIVDLGCGNGVVGLIAAARNPQCKILFTDQSYLSVDSARMNFESSGLHNDVVFEVGDALSSAEPETQDLVLCNPPFHQQTVVGDAIAWRMFKTAKKALKVGGELRIVGNRHLKYHQKMKYLFGNVEQLSANPKFVILKSIKDELQKKG